jgi:recombination DNA repair RAD52 pathway protein
MELLITMAFAVLLETVKNTGKRDALRRAFAKMYNAIGNAYKLDKEFWALVEGSQPF